MFSLISLKTSIESTTYRCDRNTKAIRDNSDTEETERGGGGGGTYTIMRMKCRLIWKMPLWSCVFFFYCEAHRVPH